MARVISTQFSVLTIDAAAEALTASLDLEIIAQRKADEKDEGDREKVLREP
jgi:hypothetical protein